MPLYRLLRSNKESGPYSLNDLVTLGLKPYDLVWVDGRSAAWRYPSEITELKEYAPIVEEQPYDRFYKKPSENEALKESNAFSHQEIVAPQKTINENFVKEEPIQKILKPAEATNGIKKIVPEIPSHTYQSYEPQVKKKVFVSMPETTEPDPYGDEKYNQYLPKSKPVQQDLIRDEKSYSPINVYQSEESKLETKYTQSLDDIKEMYVNTLVQRKTRNRRKEIFRKYVRPALLPVLLVIAGVAIGYFITNRKSSLQASSSVSKVVPQQTSPEQKIADTAAIENQLQPEEKQNALSSTDNKNEKIITPSEEKYPVSQEKKFTQVQKENKNAVTETNTANPTLKEKQTFIPPAETSSAQKKSAEVDPVTGERKSVVREKNNIASTENNNTRNVESSINKKDNGPSFLDNEHKDIHDLVSVKSNNYIRGTFGGISGLELTVYNNSGFLLDEVNVELQIMKPSEQPLRTDIITFRNISANGTVTVKVPDSQRGVRVDYKITNIESKQWLKSTAGL